MLSEIHTSTVSKETETISTVVLTMLKFTVKSSSSISKTGSDNEKFSNVAGFNTRGPTTK